MMMNARNGPGSVPTSCFGSGLNGVFAVAMLWLGVGGMVIVAVVGVGGLTGCTRAERPVNALLRTGDAAERQGRWAEAEADYLLAVERRPGNPDARIALGELYLRTGRAAEARTEFEVARAVRPGDEEVVRLLARSMLDAGDTGDLVLLARDWATDRGTAEAWVQAGDWMGESGDVDSALVAYRTAARVDGGRSPAIQKRLGAFHESLGDREAALRRYRMALYLDPRDEETMAAIRGLGEVPGPTYGLVPAELDRGEGASGG